MTSKDCMDEAAITKKSQAIASQRKEAEAQGLKYASALETLQKELKKDGTL